MKKTKNLFLFFIFLFSVLFLFLLTKIYNRNDKDKDESFNKPEERKRNTDLYEKNDISIDDVKNEQLNEMRTINPTTNYVDYTYFNNRSKRHSYNIGFEPQSPLQTERNISFTIKP